MAKKDMGEKLLADYNDVFADIVNAYTLVQDRFTKQKDRFTNRNEILRNCGFQKGLCCV